MMPESSTPSARAVPESQEVRAERFWRAGGGFRWCWPRLTVYVPADRRRRVGWNRYPHNIIGVCVVMFGRAFSLRWKGARND